MSTQRRFRLSRALPLALVLLTSTPAFCLDKQGSAHGGKSEVVGEGQRIGGSLLFGAAFFNPSYAARPDNTGLALFRLAGHADFDLIGQHLSIPLDLNLFTDRTAPDAGFLVPSELDVITGVTSTWALPRGAIEFGVRGEADMGVDRSTLTQGYVDARARYLLDSGDFGDDLQKWLGPHHFSTATTLGWFAYNPTYGARPDNSGLALFRYAEHLGYGVGIFDLGVDLVFFTDREANVIAPSEFDLSFDAGVTLDDFGVRVAYERDMPVDRGGLVQHFAFTYLTYSFGVELSAPQEPVDSPALPTSPSAPTTDQ